MAYQVSKPEFEDVLCRLRRLEDLVKSVTCTACGSKEHQRAECPDMSGNCGAPWLHAQGCRCAVNGTVTRDG